MKFAAVFYWLLLTTPLGLGQSSSLPVTQTCGELGTLDSCNTFNAMLQSQDTTLEVLTHKGSDHYVCFLPKNTFTVVSISRPKVTKTWVDDLGSIESETFTSGALTGVIDASIILTGPPGEVSASLDSRGFVNKPLPKIVTLSVNPYWLKIGTQYKLSPSGSRIEELTITTSTLTYTLSNEILGRQEQVATGRCLKYGN